MPFSDLFRMANLKPDSPHPYGPDDDECLELVWENGQVVMQGHSSRSKKESSSNNQRSLVPKPQEGMDPSNPRMERFGTVDSRMNDFNHSVPLCPVGLDKYDELAPWLNFPVEESLNIEYGSDFLSELSGLSGNDISRVSSEKRSSLSYLPRDVHINSMTNSIHFGQKPISKASLNAAEPDGHGKGQEFAQQHTTPRPGDPSFADCNTSGTSLLKHDAGQPNNHYGFLRFCSVSRPAEAASVSHKNLGAATGSVPSGAKMLTEAKGYSASTSSCRNPTEQDLVNDGNNFSWKEMPPSTQPLFGSGKQDQLSSMRSHPIKELLPDNQSHASCLKNKDKTEKRPNLVASATTMGSKVAGGDQKNGEPAGTASSVCSGSSVDRASHDPNLSMKRKAHEMGESECPSEDAEEESFGVRKASPAPAGSKRGRAAEVHNLSERRRRDRINEKMRALQELIPNCNKADKASMLDEAIEYLKTLQLQLQMLSMGAGFYMPQPMMLPGGMQHIPRAHMHHFSPVGYGMGMAYGMNMVNMNGDMIQSPAVQGQPYPVYGSQITGPSNFRGMMATSSPQTSGHPQGVMPVSAPHASPVVAFPGGPPLNLPMGLNISGMTGPVNSSNLAQSTGSRGVMQNVGTQGMPSNTSNVDVSANQPMDWAINTSVEPSALRQNQAHTVINSETPNPGAGTDIKPS